MSAEYSRFLFLYLYQKRVSSNNLFLFWSVSQDIFISPFSLHLSPFSFQDGCQPLSHGRELTSKWFRLITHQGNHTLAGCFMHSHFFHKKSETWSNCWCNTSVSVSSVFLLFPWNNLTLQLYQNKETISYNCWQLLKSIKILCVNYRQAAHVMRVLCLWLHAKFCACHHLKGPNVSWQDFAHPWL